MTEKRENHMNNKRRTQVNDLPRAERELTANEQKKVQGGATRAVTPGIRTTTTGSGGSTGGSTMCGI